VTAPAPSPELPQETPPVDKKSRKVYVLWATALTLLISTALFCWLVVVPVWQTRAVVRRCFEREMDLRTALQRLGGPERALPKLRLYLCMPRAIAPSHEKGCAVYLVGFCGKGSLPALLEVLGDQDPVLRLWAAETLCRTDHEAFALTPLMQALRDPDRDVRRVAARAIGNACWRMRQVASGSKHIAPQLELRKGELVPHYELLPSELPGPDLGLWLAPPGNGAGPVAHKLVPDLLKALDDPDARVREAVIVALGTIGQEASETVPVLVKLFADLDPRVRVAILRALIWLRDAGVDAVPHIPQSVSDTDPRVRRLAMRYLRGSSLSVKQIVTGLRKGLRDEDKMVRSAAAWELGEIGPPALGAVAALEAVLADPEPFNRITAGVALIRIDQGNKKALLTLEKALQHQYHGVRSSAAHALGDLGLSAGRAVASLRRLLQDKDKAVRQAAAEALKKIKAKQEEQKR
jgi:HEAT repeat protein